MQGIVRQERASRRLDAGIDSIAENDRRVGGHEFRYYLPAGSAWTYRLPGIWCRNDKSLEMPVPRSDRRRNRVSFRAYRKSETSIFHINSREHGAIATEQGRTHAEP